MNSKLVETAKRYAELQAAHKKASEFVKDLNQEWDTCEQELLSLLVDEGVNNIALDGIGKISMSSRNFLSVNASNKPAFFEYLKKNGLDGILKLDINPKTLGSFLDEHLTTLIDKATESGTDPFEAKALAIEFLKSQGVTYFLKRGISLRAGG